jgi:hypothetical protein
VPSAASAVDGADLLDAQVEIEQESFNGVGAVFADVDRDAIHENAAGDEHPHARDTRDDGRHLLELGCQEIDERRELERHEVASRRRSVAGRSAGSISSSRSKNAS